MHILDRIVEYKRKEVALRKLETPLGALQNKVDRDPVSLRDRIKSGSGVIAEFKRRSPSKPTLNVEAKVEQITPLYESSGVSGISILTDNHFFGGSDADLTKARELNTLPLLRKDFVVDEYQIYEASTLGADCILLIARILTAHEIKHLMLIARELGLEVLVEIHNQKELDKLTDLPDLVGVNNRNLDTFEVDYQHSIDLIAQLPADACKIAESGIHSVEVMWQLSDAGFDGFLMGERFMATASPGIACKQMVKDYLNRKM